MSHATTPRGDDATPQRPRISRRSWLTLVLALTLSVPLTGCARRAAVPTAETPAPRPVQLAGLPVMVLPAQSSALSPTLTSAFDAELAYWLGERAPRVKWTSADQVERMLANSPGVRIDVHALGVQQFGRMRLERIGDPLFGDVHNLGAMFDARLALIPVSVAYVVPRDSAGRTAPGPGRLEVAAALVETFGGEVRWYGIVRGEAGPIDAPATVASAARALAAALLPES